jgi:hypothetical protein
MTSFPKVGSIVPSKVVPSAPYNSRLPPFKIKHKLSKAVSAEVGLVVIQHVPILQNSNFHLGTETHSLFAEDFESACDVKSLHARRDVPHCVSGATQTHNNEDLE